MIAVILGRPISGGSALAAAIVAMGYHPGRTIFGPCAPAFRSDWEDAELTPPLIAGTRPDVEQWQTIIDVRLEQSSMLGCAGPLMKSPTFCLAGQPFIDALSAYSSKIYWVTRDDSDRKRSMKSYPVDARKTLERIDAEISDEMADWADAYISYEELLTAPASVLGLVAEELGATDRLAEAVAAIGSRRLDPCRW